MIPIEPFVHWAQEICKITALMAGFEILILGELALIDPRKELADSVHNLTDNQASWYLRSIKTSTQQKCL